MTIDEDVEKARARNRGLATSVYGPAFDSDSYTTYGTLDTCVARLQSVVDAGCNEVIISPPDLGHCAPDSAGGGSGAGGEGVILPGVHT